MKVKTLAAATLLCFALSAPAFAAEEKVTLNFVNSDLEATLKAVTIITGKSFIIDPKLKGTVNIVSSQPVDRSLILPIVQSALRQQGITLVDNGTVVKVLPESDAKQQGSPVIIGSNKVGTGDKYVTQVYPLHFESASQLAQVLRPLLGPNSTITAYQAGNVLVISDYAENLSRINRMLEHLDQAPSGDIVALPIKHASVLEVAQTVARMIPEVVLQGTTAPVNVPEGVRRVMVVTDTRNSQLLVSSESPAHIARIKRIIEMLDQPGGTGSTMHVVYLRNAEATRLASTLRGILTGQESGTSANNSLSGSSATTPTTTSTGTSSASSTAASSATSSTTTPTNTSTSVKIDGFTVMIQADAVTNSLIITAPDRVFDDINKIVEKLDVRRAQVFIEAMIVELNVSNSAEVGVQMGGYGKGAALGVGSISTSSDNSLATLSTAYLANKSSSSSAITVPEGFNIAVGSGTFGALLSAIQQSSDANVLSTPNLQMLDNEEARIVVGQNIPIKTGTTISSSSTFSSVERKDIGIKLKIKPQISEGGAVTLTVAQEVSSIDTSVNTSDQGIATKVRSIETKVLVDDGQYVVLGGLIEDQSDNAENRVPILSDIPLIGHLFRYRSRSHKKVNLMVFLHPTVLRDGAANKALANERYDYIRQVQGNYDAPHSMVLPDLPRVQLPSVTDTTAPAHAAKPEAPSSTNKPATEEAPKAP